MLVLLLSTIFYCFSPIGVSGTDLSGIKYFEVVHLVVYNPQQRYQQFTSTKPNVNYHFENVVIEFYAFNRLFRLDINKNNVFKPNVTPFYVLQKDNEISKVENVEHCYYDGIIENKPSSLVHLSTCHGFSGVINDVAANESFVLETLSKNSTFNEYILYRPEDVTVHYVEKCYRDHSSDHHVVFDDNNEQETEPKILSRQKRAVGKKYLEVLMVGDAALVKKEEGRSKAIHRILDITNHAKKVYKTINIDLIVVGVFVMEKNAFSVVSSAGDTLGHFRKYMKTDVVKKLFPLNQDTAHLISGTRFGSGEVGYAGQGSMCDPGAGITSDGKSRADLVANTVAHEIGHNLGMVHIGSSGCDRCVMAATVAWSPVTNFAQANKDKYEKRMNGGGFKCLNNYPKTNFGNAKCGNGLRENKEECDCGTKAQCEFLGVDECCDHTTCKLQSGAKCADGPCCSDCDFLNQGVLCRGASRLNECEFSEYCSGNSSECPVNFYARNGIACQTNKICVNGQCVSRRPYKATPTCTQPCLNEGVCNSNGNCNCLPGYACPYCEHLGAGGSLDSGQGCTDPNVCKDGCLSLAVKIILIVLFVLPFCILIGYLIFRNRKDMMIQWKNFIHDVRDGGAQTTRSRPAVQKTMKQEKTVKAKKVKQEKVVKSTNKTKAKDTLANPHVTYKQPNKTQQQTEKSTKALKQPKTQAPTPIASNQKSNLSAASAKPKNLPAIGGSSPNPGLLKLQIQSYNNMDAEAGNIRPSPKWPSPNPPAKTYR